MSRRRRRVPSVTDLVSSALPSCRRPPRCHARGAGAGGLELTALEVSPRSLPSWRDSAALGRWSLRVLPLPEQRVAGRTVAGRIRLPAARGPARQKEEEEEEEEDVAEDDYYVSEG